MRPHALGKRNARAKNLELWVSGPERVPRPWNLQAISGCARRGPTVAGPSHSTVGAAPAHASKVIRPGPSTGRPSPRNRGGTPLWRWGGVGQVIPLSDDLPQCRRRLTVVGSRSTPGGRSARPGPGPPSPDPPSQPSGKHQVVLRLVPVFVDGVPDLALEVQPEDGVP